MAGESETVFLATVEEAMVPAGGEIEIVRYRVEETVKGFRTPGFLVEYRLGATPETEVRDGRRRLAASLFRPGARHLVFVRNPRYGIDGGAATEDPSRAIEATPERVEWARRAVTGN